MLGKPDQTAVETGELFGEAGELRADPACVENRLQREAEGRERH
jgi:hypothetical protein